MYVCYVRRNAPLCQTVSLSSYPLLHVVLTCSLILKAQEKHLCSTIVKIASNFAVISSHLALPRLYTNTNYTSVDVEPSWTRRGVKTMTSVKMNFKITFIKFLHPLRLWTDLSIT